MWPLSPSVKKKKKTNANSHLRMRGGFGPSDIYSIEWSGH
jgi:hypothetical protein